MPIAAMLGVFFYGECDGRRGKWKSEDGFSGRYTLVNQVLTFTIKRRPRGKDPTTIENLLRRVVEGWSNKSLRDLEMGFEKMRRRLQRTQSTREVGLAVSKSAPYVIITLIVGVVSYSLYSKTVDPATLFIGTATTALVLLAWALSWFISTRSDSNIASLTIYSDNVQKSINEREAQMRGAFRMLEPDISKITFGQHNIAFNDEVRVLKGRTAKLVGGVGGARFTDMHYRFPGLIDKVLQAQKTAQDAVNGLERILQIVESRIKAIDDESGGDANWKQSDRVPTLARASFLVCSGIVKSNDDLKEEESKGLGNAEAKWARDLIADKSNKFSNDLDLINLANATKKSIDQFQISKAEILSTIDYLFSSG